MERLSAIVVLLHLSVMLGDSAASVQQLKRQKRDWIVPTKNLRENTDYTNKGYVARIRSDTARDGELHYSLTGPGASQVPVNKFVVDGSTGLVYVLGSLDREEKDIYILTGVARYHNGKVAESGIMIKFEVEDENDNTPIFPRVPPATVFESSPAGTLVGVITATDADKANTSHSRIAYKIIKQEPPDGRDHFYINRKTGAIYLKENTLDRERQDFYNLTITGTDLDGDPKGNTGDTTILIKVVDINDHKAKLEKDEYSGSVKENTAKVEVMRFKVLDDDQKNTDNWLAEFDIVSGNEDGTFSISTDPKTNEGVLMLEKPVDFEKNPDIKLGVVVSNVAPFVGDGGGDGGGKGEGEGDGDGAGGGGGAGAGGGGGGGAGAGAGAGAGGGGGAGAGAGGGGGAGAGAGGGGGGGAGGGGAGGGGGASGSTGASNSTKTTTKKKKTKTGKLYPVNIAVLNEREGSTFRPAVKPISVSENPKESPLRKVIDVFSATDSDTGELAEDVRYAKGYDPDNWLLIDPETAEIRLQKVPDRESPFVVNGTYYAKILCLPQDSSHKIATGTIALKVGDVNDNCPLLTNKMEYLCSDTQVVNVTAVDEDGDPNAGPLSFSIVDEESQGKWRVEPFNDTSASLRAMKPLWPGHYKVTFIIKDKQGVACPEPQKLELHVCSCEGGETCAPTNGTLLKESSSKFGGLGVGALILGLVTLLLVGLLLVTCSCGDVSGSFSELPFDTRDHLIVYHTEGRGEDKDVPLLSSSAQKASADIAAVQIGAASKTRASAPISFMYMTKADVNNTLQSRAQHSGLTESSWREGYSMEEELLQYDCMSDIALPDEFLHEYYSQKASCAAENQAARDCLLEYDYEGQGSSAGSVVSGSLLGSDADLQFLDDLGLKFKTLAEICLPPRPPTPVTRENIVIQEVDKVEAKPPTIHVKSSERNQSKVDHIAGPSLEAKPPTKSLKLSQKVSTSQSSTKAVGFNGAASSSALVHSSHSTNRVAQSSHVSPVTSPVLSSAGQMLLLQQQSPVYYTTTPMLQPINYMVQPQLQSTMVLAEAPVTNLQGMILLNGMSGHTGHIIQGGNTAGTLTLGGKIANIVVEENQGVGPWLRSEGSGTVIGVKRNGRRISEGGAKLEYFSTGAVMGRDICVKAAGPEGGQVVPTERKIKTRTVSAS